MIKKCVVKVKLITKNTVRYIFKKKTCFVRVTTSTTMHRSIFSQEETWLPTVSRRYSYLQFVYLYFDRQKKRLPVSEAIAAFFKFQYS